MIFKLIDYLPYLGVKFGLAKSLINKSLFFRIMNEMLNTFKKLKSSKEFKENSKDSYLTSCVKMGKDSHLDNSWQFDFYSKKTHKITSFQVDKNITVQKDQEIFSDKNKSPEELDIMKVKVNLKEALAIAKKHKEVEQQNDSINKEIIILQESDQIPIWNITFLTSAFNIINIKIDADSSKIIKYKCESIMSFKLK